MARGEKGIDSIKFLIKLGKLDKEALVYMDYVNFSRVFGWLPSQIDQESPRMLKIYQCILAGQNAKQPVTGRQENREMNGYG